MEGKRFLTILAFLSLIAVCQAANSNIIVVNPDFATHYTTGGREMPVAWQERYGMDWDPADGVSGSSCLRLVPPATANNSKYTFYQPTTARGVTAANLPPSWQTFLLKNTTYNLSTWGQDR